MPYTIPISCCVEFFIFSKGKMAYRVWYNYDTSRFEVLTYNGKVVNGGDFRRLYSVVDNGTSLTLTAWNVTLGNYTFACRNSDSESATTKLIVLAGNFTSMCHRCVYFAFGALTL